MMRSEKLDRRITIERALVAYDDDNQPVVEWVELTTVWASKLDISDGEKVRAAQVGATLTTRFQIRWSSMVADVNPKDRIVSAGVTYDISGVKEIGRREGVEITAAAKADETPSSIVGIDMNNLFNSQYLPLLEAMIDG